MNDYNSDEAKEFRRARLLKVKPKAAPMLIMESDFNREYTEYRFVSIEHSAELEETNNVMFCPACVKDVNSQMRKVRVLHVSYEDDPLGNYPLIAVAKCQGCDWEEMIPVVKQEITADDQRLLRRFHNAQASQNIGSGRSSSAGLMNPGLWTSKIEESLMQPGMIHRVESLRPSIDFGQAKANRVWEEVAKNEQERVELNAARAQIEMIERLEAETRNRAQSNAAAKTAMMGQAYGMDQSRLQDYMNQYAQRVSSRLAKQIDADVMRQMQNMSFTHDEITTLKREPAKAAQAAHKTLGDHIKLLREKFDKKDRK